jgi:hypothetical protein
LWIQLESFAPYIPGSREKFDNILSTERFDLIEFANPVTASESTYQATFSMLTGVQSSFLMQHFYLDNDECPPGWAEAGIVSLPAFLREKGYEVIGFNDVYEAPKHLPMFGDTHIGAGGKDPKISWKHEISAIDRLKGHLGNLRPESTALLFHLWDIHRVNEIFEDLHTVGFNKDNTVVALMSDHGSDEMPEFLTNSELAAEPDFILRFHRQRLRFGGREKYSLYESVIKTALALAYPGSARSARSELVSAMDFAPTVVDLLGFDSSRDIPVTTGMSLAGLLLRGEKLPKRILRVDNRYPGQRNNKIIAFVNESYRYVHRFDCDWEQQPNYKLQRFATGRREELYRRDDAAEKVNLADDPSHRHILDMFRKELRESESSVILHHYSKDLFEYNIFNERFHQDLGTGPASVSEYHCWRLRNDMAYELFNRTLLKMALRLHPGVAKAQKIALFGAGSYSNLLLSHSLIYLDDERLRPGKIVAVFDNNPKEPVLRGVPVMRPSRAAAKGCDALVVCHGFREAEMCRDAGKWAPPGMPILTVWSNYDDFWPRILRLSDLPPFDEPPATGRIPRLARVLGDVSEPGACLVVSGDASSVLESLRKTSPASCLLSFEGHDAGKTHFRRSDYTVSLDDGPVELRELSGGPILEFLETGPLAGFKPNFDFLAVEGLDEQPEIMRDWMERLPGLLRLFGTAILEVSENSDPLEVAARYFSERNPLFSTAVTREAGRRAYLFQKRSHPGNAEPAPLSI